jgi:hypothetical protein
MALFLAVAMIALAAVPGPEAAQAAQPPLLRQFCNEGAAAGECVVPIGIAVDPTSGNVYVGDRTNGRINEFTAWGAFIRSWGFGVRDGSPELQTCTALTACQQGTEGAEPGMIVPFGLALDSTGAVYVVDLSNHRVQKFVVPADPEAPVSFALMFGGGVNQGPLHPGNLCTAANLAEGDQCGAGSTGTGTGEFGAWELGSFIAINEESPQTVYVGDQGRIQEFGTDGVFKGFLPDPDGALAAGGTVQSLAADSAGDLYVAFDDPEANGLGVDCCSKENVIKLNPAGELRDVQFQVSNPRAIAVAGDNTVYVVDSLRPGQARSEAKVRRFNPQGIQLDSPGFGGDALGQSWGIATSSPPTCGLQGTAVFVSNSTFLNINNPTESFVALYGAAPDPTICPPPEVPPSIEDQSTLTVDTDGAAVRAQINPHFWPDTRYYVQFGTGKCSEGGCDRSQPAAPGSLLSSQTVEAGLRTSAVALSGLQPDTTYHYRFVAFSSGGGPVYGVGGTEAQDGEETTFHTPPAAVESNTQCPNQAFRTGASAKLADCRAYEMVSPLDKDNTDVSIGASSYTQASFDGNRMVYAAYRAFANPEAAPLFPQLLASRDPVQGWSTTSISPPRSPISLYPLGASLSLLQYKAFSDDLCSGWVIQDTEVTFTPEAPPKVGNLYRRDFCGQAGYELLTTTVPPGFGYEPNSDFGYKPLLQGFSADGSRSVIRANAALTPNATEKKDLFQLYGTDGAGHLRLISLLPNGKAASTDSSAGTPQNEVSEKDSVRHAVSADGSRVFWTASLADGLHGMGPGSLYLRLNALQAPGKAGSGCSEAGKACTIAISAAPARFETADPEGTVAIYAAGKFDNGTPNVYENGEAKLYEFDIATETSHLISNSVRGVMGASEDARRVYFASNAVLTGEEANGEGDKAQAGQPNLYRYEAGEGGGEITFVATLSSADASNSTTSSEFPSPLATWTPLRTSRVSPDGLHAAFTSTQPLTGYDNRDVANGRPDAELFVYDADTGALHCASCDPTGARPVGQEVGRHNNGAEQLWSAVRPKGWASQYRQPNSLSSDGKRLFFDSFGTLAPGDTNGKTDVYEWEAAGSGDCTEQSNSFSEANEGCITLISSGQSPEDSEFFDATPSGSDVFFATQSSLLVQDYGLTDVYDARVNGGFPAPSPVPPACEGEACQGPLAPPNDPTPASSSYEGSGNTKAPAKKKAKKHKKQRAKKAGHRRAGANGRTRR